jgi:hypothetical protein
LSLALMTRQFGHGMRRQVRWSNLSTDIPPPFSLWRSRQMGVAWKLALMTRQSGYPMWWQVRRSWKPPGITNTNSSIWQPISWAHCLKSHAFSFLSFLTFAIRWLDSRPRKRAHFLGSSWMAQICDMATLSFSHCRVSSHSRSTILCSWNRLDKMSCKPLG